MKVTLPDFDDTIRKIYNSIEETEKRGAEISEEVNKWGNRNQKQAQFMKKLRDTLSN